MAIEKIRNSCTSVGPYTRKKKEISSKQMLSHNPYGNEKRIKSYANDSYDISSMKMLIAFFLRIIQYGYRKNKKLVQEC